MAKIFIKPKKDVLVRFPNPTKLNDRILKEDGEYVDYSMYWIRRERDGDVIRSTDDININTNEPNNKGQL